MYSIHVEEGYIHMQRPACQGTWWVLSSTANLFLASQTAVRPDDRFPSTTAELTVVNKTLTIPDTCKNY